MANDLDAGAIETTIRHIYKETFEEHVESGVAPDLEAETILLETGLDSLGFAIVVARLEEELGFDPFSLSDEARYPVTFSEFVQFYADAQH